MSQLLEIRAKLFEIFQKIEKYVMVILKAIFYFIAFNAIKGELNFNAKLSSSIIVLALAVVSSFLPTSVGLTLMVLYIALQLYSVSIIMAATVVVIAFILFCFFLRYTPEYGNVVVGMPILMGMKLPYVLPICLGLFSTPITILPVCVGVFAYHFIKGISKAVLTSDQLKAAENPFQLYMDVLDSVLKNDAMIAAMIVFSLVIIVVYAVRNIKMDYSFEIAIAAGAGTSMIGFIIMMLKFEVGVGIFSICFFSIISCLIAFLVNMIYRPLFYAGTEQVQFEDDYYYYYVKAIPKIKVAGAKVNVKHVVSRRVSSFDEDFGDELDEIDSNVALSTKKSFEDTEEFDDEEFEEVRRYTASSAGKGVRSSGQATSVRNTSTGYITSGTLTGSMPSRGNASTKEQGAVRTITGTQVMASRTATGAQGMASRTAAGTQGTVRNTSSGATVQRSSSSTANMTQTRMRTGETPQSGTPVSTRNTRTTSSAKAPSVVTKRTQTPKKTSTKAKADNSGLTLDYSSDYVRSYEDEDDDF